MAIGPSTGLKRMRVQAITYALLTLVALPVLADDAAAAARDRDHDGLSDRWEQRYGLSVHSKNASRDPDHDSLSNLSEQRRKLNPRRADTDRDGLSDGRETRRTRTDARRRDTDGDRFSDALEVLMLGTDPLDASSPQPPRPTPPGTAPPAPTPPAPAPPAPIQPPPTTGQTRYVAPGGTGSGCTQAAPCGSINAAYQIAAPGDAIELAAGSYGPQNVSYRSAAGSWTANVVARPASGASVSLSGLDIGSPHLTVEGIKTTYAVFNYNSHFGRFEDMTVAGPTTITEANDIAIVKSRLGPSPGNDTLKIGPGNSGSPVPTNILVEDSELGPALLTQADQHLDAIQTHGAANLTIRRNVIREADSQNIKLGQESGPNTNILVENNLIEQCAPQRSNCRSSWATSGSGTDVRFVNNTIRGGAYPDQATYLNNILGYAQCTAGKPMSSNLIQTLSWDSAGCPATNMVGAPTYKPGGFQLAPSSLGVDAADPTVAPALDKQGNTRYDDPSVANRPGIVDVGASELVP